MSKSVWVMIGRDPFARGELVRRVHRGHPFTCYECDNDARFVYGWKEDQHNGRVSEYSGVFCGVSCFRAYHEE